MMWGFLYVVTFIIAFSGLVAFKMKYNPFGKEFSVDWNDSVGMVHTDIPYGSGEANKFDLYVPADSSRENYGLIGYLHAGGFMGGDKSGPPVFMWKIGLTWGQIPISLSHLTQTGIIRGLLIYFM